MSWMTEKLKVANAGALTTAQAVISQNFRINGPEYMCVEITTEADETGDIYLYDSADGTTFTQVATAAVDATGNTAPFVWRLDARTTPIRNYCRLEMKLDAGTGTVSTIYVTRVP